MKYLFTFLLLVSCGNKGLYLSDNIGPLHDETLKSLIHGIEQDLGIKVNSDIFVQSDIKTQNSEYDHPLGLCTDYHNPNIRDKITIDVEKIKLMGFSVKLVLLHEIGHCEFGYNDYKERTDSIDCTVSIMSWGGKFERCDKNYNRYINQIRYEIMPSKENTIIYSTVSNPQTL
jgi:hypothetical protein